MTLAPASSGDERPQGDGDDPSPVAGEAGGAPASSPHDGPPSLKARREAELAALEVPDLTPRARQIVDTALTLLETHGPDALSMRTVAARLGVRAPSLYKHLPDKRAMENAIIAIGLRAQGEHLLGRIAGAEDPVWALVLGFREWALAHPHLYALMMSAALDPGPMVRSAELLAGRAVRDVVGDDPALALALWSFAHGVIDLEMKGRLPPDSDVEALLRRGIDAMRP